MNIKYTFPQKKFVLLFLLASFVCIEVQSQILRRDSLRYQIRRIESKNDFNPKDSTYIKLLTDLGKEMRFYNSDSLFLISSEALTLALEADDKYGQGNSYEGLGSYFEDQGKYGEAIKYYKKSLAISEERNDYVKILEIENHLANVYRYMGDYAESLKLFLKSIEYAKLLGDDKMLSILNENIANLYVNQENYEQAVQYYKIVKKINQRIGNEVYMAETMSNLASAYAEMGEFEYAMYNINSSIGVFEKHKIMDWLAYAYEVKGKTYLKNKDYKWALFWYKQGEMLHKNIDDIRGETSLLNGIAEVYLGQGKDSLSEHYALKAMDLSKKLNFKEEIRKGTMILYKVNKNKGDLETALDYHEQYQAINDTIMAHRNEKNLTMLITKLDFDKEKEQLIIENEQALADQKRYIYAAMLLVGIFLVVTLAIYRNKKILKNLNDELQSKTLELIEHEKELRASNETKDKLFSIIGHDLRGPIAAFQGLLKLYRNGEIGSNDFLQFIPKLGKDLDNISFTLNNLLSWGRTQMNGSSTKPSAIALENLVIENINLLEESASTKSIQIVNKVFGNTLCWADGDQIDIVIRNLISNAIKFTPENGTITVSVNERGPLWEISVKDTGIGIKEEVQKKLFKKNANITTYGTNDEKGTGLGLSLCKEMVEKNNGDIWVESTIPKGSCFYFTLPKMRNNLKKAG
ncbi:tetratricopeptide repeat-containing sensor histidine kinase [Maribacter polysaccharolyticus]|uniref:tetratricopeptide repeat-containing sensor histidine kinase n=1 Tax=Maribacter polysaccharolyticus TaxID=3020831 RepID=UPI00237F5957|nr:tetratricopeptide repeat-containing sensor histidine kinase [Maribacter polysaccharolyticus]MDE3740333.1 tetratricopeptide repeat-containing sensor histidine kinase [Maribacter polysaccharolyticus]